MSDALEIERQICAEVVPHPLGAFGRHLVVTLFWEDGSI